MPYFRIGFQADTRMIRCGWLRKVLVVGLLAAFSAGVSCYLIRASSASRITEDNANRIEPGMTLEEVEQILGPERDETYGEWTFSQNLLSR